MTKVENNAATEARLPRIESYESQLSIQCCLSSVAAVFSTFVATSNFHGFREIFTKNHEFNGFLLHLGKNDKKCILKFRDHFENFKVSRK